MTRRNDAINDILSKLDIKDASTPLEKLNALVKFYNDGHEQIRSMQATIKELRRKIDSINTPDYGIIYDY